MLRPQLLLSWRVPAFALCAAACWVAQPFVPWSARGALSTTTPLEAAQLLRSGVITSLPRSLMLSVLVLPIAAVILLTLSLSQSRRAALGRLAVAVSTTGVILVLLAGARTSNPFDSLGFGAVLALVGAAASLLSSLPLRRRLKEKP